ncbi:NAD-binding protein [Promicromonospora xylanilytica]
MPSSTRSRRPHFVVCGGGPLAYRVTFALSTRYQGDVTVILPDAASEHATKMGTLDGVRIVVSARPDTAALERASIGTACAVALLDQDDAGNIETALLVNELRPGLRIVVRFFDDKLGSGIARHLPNCDVLSASKIAAPQLVSLALDEARHLDVPGLDLVVAESGQPAGKQIAVLTAVDGHDDGVMLPSPGTPEIVPKVVLAHPVRDPAPAGTAYRSNGKLWHYVRSNLNRYVWYAVGALALITLAGATLLVAAQGAPEWGTALYQVVLHLLVGADPDTGTPILARLVQVVLTVVSVAVIPLLTAALVDAVVRARLAAAVSGPGTTMTGHVVVVGMGDVGTRVLTTLLERGIAVVAIDTNDKARGIQVARTHRVPVVIGDGRQPDVLAAAQVGGARAILAVTSDDIANIGITIATDAIDRAPDAAPLRRVLRLFDEDFARRIQGLIPGSAPRSASQLAAPAFAASVTGPDVHDTVAFRDRVLLVAEVPMHAHAALERRPAREVDVPGEVRLVAVRLPHRSPGADVVLNPTPGFPLQHNYRLIVVATRSGLERLRGRTAHPQGAGRRDARGSKT